MRTLSQPEISAGVIEACRQGDRDAFRVLYETYKDKVYSITLYYFHGDADLARDATQQAFLKALTGIAQFRGDSGFATWLYRLVVNVCRDRSRSAARRETAVDLANVAHVGQSYEDGFVQQQESARIRAALSSLPPKLRMPVLLRYFEDLSYGELAEALHCSTGTVASRLSRGHQLLRQKLESLRSTAAAKR